MDKTEMYVKMADCEEVQKEWKPKRADYYVNTGDYADDGCDPIEQEIRNCLFDNDICVLHYWERSGYFTQSSIAKSKLNGKWQGLWLPRQDQIQEMLHADEQWLEKDNSPFKFPIRVGDSKWNYILQHFIRYNDMAGLELPDRLGDTVFSFEQLWLAFYMKEKHGKTWNGEKWAKQNE